MATAPEEILDYWFRQVGSDHWFEADAARDREIATRFLKDHEQAARGELKAWEDNPTGVLCLLLLFDQFPRHMFRGMPRAFATDHAALELARTAIIKHFDDRIDAAYKLCFYLPFAHAESMSDQRLALYYIRERAKHPQWLDMVEHNYNVIQRFGRFPERNKALSRPSTTAEQDYLQEPAAGF